MCYLKLLLLENSRGFDLLNICITCFFNIYSPHKNYKRKQQNRLWHSSMRSKIQLLKISILRRSSFEKKFKQYSDTKEGSERKYLTKRKTMFNRIYSEKGQIQQDRIVLFTVQCAYMTTTFCVKLKYILNFIFQSY